MKSENPDENQKIWTKSGNHDENQELQMKSRNPDEIRNLIRNLSDFEISYAKPARYWPLAF